MAPWARPERCLGHGGRLHERIDLSAMGKHQGEDEVSDSQGPLAIGLAHARLGQTKEGRPYAGGPSREDA